MFQDYKLPQFNTVLILLLLLIWRMAFGLCSEFWFPDELQIYLLGLKWYTTGAWPYYGPDVVYTQTQIPGALQALLVGAPLHIWPVPESPVILLNLLSFMSLTLFGYYLSKRFTQFPSWFIYAWVLTALWPMNYGTRVVNPSYVLVFSIPFFISAIELLPIYTSRIFNTRVCSILMGLCTACIMQLHLSYVLLLPFAIMVFVTQWRSGIQHALNFAVLYFIGFVAGSVTLWPTLLHPQTSSPAVSANIQFHAENILQLFTILLRLLSFASFEVPYMLGGNTAERLSVITQNIWMAPFAVILLVTGFAQVALFIVKAIFYPGKSESTDIRNLLVLSWLMVFGSFFFSVKGPSSHTFFVMWPLPMLWSFYCYGWMQTKFSWFKQLLTVLLVCSVFFELGWGIYNYHNKSLYKDRQRIVKAIKERDYHILGNRRADEWGYGY